MRNSLDAVRGTFQRTLRRPIRFTGIGLHSGATITMTLSPAPVDQGVVFVRSDLRGGAAVVPAGWDAVVDTRMCTVLGNAAGTTVGTVEHIMAAFRGCGVDNVTVTLDAPETAIMDGSAAPFTAEIDEAGVVEQDAPRRYIRILRPITVRDGDKSVSLSPSDQATFSFEIDFDSPVISRQSATFVLNGPVFRRDLAGARTFGFLEEVEALRGMGLARGGSLDNVIVISEDRVLNEDGLRFENEFVRHKILDAVGDLYQAGAPIIGAFRGLRSGHAMNNRLLRAVFADASAWCWEGGLPVSSPMWNDRRAFA